MPIHRFIQELIIPTGLDQLWEFISSPQNLKKITPDTMGFDILTPDLSPSIYPGMMITYRIKPFPGFSTQWVTEITQVVDKHYFIDEQRSGPFSIWHHEHHLVSFDQGVKMIDIIHYQLPFGWLGSLVHPLVLSKIHSIFNYRKKKLEKLFPTQQIV